jgi:predicted metal-dependent phosphoesterase TrpH
LNCQKSAENIRTFKELKEYKNFNPEIFIIVPHPFFDMTNSISKKVMIEFMDIFDAIEHSWFYSRSFNFNRRVELVANKYNKPYISTADIHFLDFLDTDYVILDCDELNVESAFKAIKGFRYENKTSPKNFFGLVGVFLKMIYLNLKSII